MKKTEKNEVQVEGRATKGEWVPSDAEMEVFKEITEQFHYKVSVDVNYDPGMSGYLCKISRKSNDQELCRGGGPTRLAALNSGLRVAKIFKHLE